MRKYFLLLLLLLFISSCKQPGQAYKELQNIEGPLQDTSILVTSTSGRIPISTTSYIFAEKRIAKLVNDNYYYYHDDHLGSHSFSTDANSNIVTEFRNLPFGEAIIGNSKYQYTGKELDKNTQLYYYGARYYTPEVGRFLQSDPVLRVNSNYAYALNNPLKYVDPSGTAEVNTNPVDVLSHLNLNDINPQKTGFVQDPIFRGALNFNMNKLDSTSAKMTLTNLPVRFELTKDGVRVKPVVKVGDVANVAGFLLDLIRGVEGSGGGSGADGKSNSLLDSPAAAQINRIVYGVKEKLEASHVDINSPERIKEKQDGRKQDGWMAGLDVVDIYGFEANLRVVKLDDYVDFRPGVCYLKKFEAGAFSAKVGLSDGKPEFRFSLVLKI